ncbi:MAG: hypothetical protein F8N37_01570 [Telmatospirillum sp.]|nr:hypothetical protein [Telmatospirillum sp.]
MTALASRSLRQMSDRGLVAGAVDLAKRAVAAYFAGLDAHRAMVARELRSASDPEARRLGFVWTGHWRA